MSADSENGNYEIVALGRLRRGADDVVSGEIFRPWSISGILKAVTATPGRSLR
ncbi:hypothetical protein KQR54_23780 [Mycobacterium gordonae]|uniref:hypothetical protein n=1 Tax=Mycobacterium gordonae TaxID=1778 RepID=UPI002109C2F6|nr:hypothetical protein [Mycobacterium gordonae]MCQ4364107.1 hypothetical protein [Mycobacterium gordonae]